MNAYTHREREIERERDIPSESSKLGVTLLMTAGSAIEG